MNILFIGMMSLIGCGYERFQKRLDNQEFDHYYALRVYMPEESRKTYLKLKTREERDAYLKEKELWDRFYQYDQEERDSIIAGEVQVGWSRDKLEMAWGHRMIDKKQSGDKRVAQRSLSIVLSNSLMEVSYFGNQIPKHSTKRYDFS
jgi:hypothetical protein